RDDRAVLLVRAVREVEAEDVGAGGDERIERALGSAGRPDGRNDFCESAHARKNRAVNVGMMWPRLTSWCVCCRTGSRPHVPMPNAVAWATSSPRSRACAPRV